MGQSVEKRQHDGPPLVRPEDIYPPPVEPWLVALDDVEVSDIREVWLGDYRFVGEAQLAGEIRDKSPSLPIVLATGDMFVHIPDDER